MTGMGVGRRRWLVTLFLPGSGHEFDFILEPYQYCFDNFGITQVVVLRPSHVPEKHLFTTILVIIFALIATLATYFAYSYRFTDPPQANFFDSIDYIAMGGTFVLIAKINLGRTP
jgi:hypothetical protein